MLCKNIYERYEAKKRKEVDIILSNKCCRICDVYTKWNNIRCPCCGSSILRTKPLNNKEDFSLILEI